MKMRNSGLITLLLIFSLLATACSSAAAGRSTDAASTENANGGLNEPTKLALGILKLEDTDQAITVEQAEELLTLWQAYQTLGSSETTAKVEMEALVSQIQSALSSEQITAIDAMGLTSDSIAEVMQGVMPDMAAGGMPQAQSTPEAGMDFGNFSGGGMPSGGGGPPSGGAMPSGGFTGGRRGQGGEMMMDDSGSVLMGGAMGTPDANAQNQFSSVGSQVNPMLLRALISMLETMIGSPQ